MSLREYMYKTEDLQLKEIIKKKNLCSLIMSWRKEHLIDGMMLLGNVFFFTPPLKHSLSNSASSIRK